LLRWLGVLVGALSLWLIHAAIGRLLPAMPALALTSVVVAGLNPQFLHIAAAVNNDVLAILAGSAAFWAIACLASQPVSSRRLALLAALALVTPLLVKLTLVPMAATVLAAVAWRSWPSWRKRLRRMALYLAGVAASGGLLLVAWPALADRLGHELFWRLLYVRPDAWEPLPAFMWFSRTYWGLVGWVAVGLDDEVIGLLTSLAMVGALASLRFLLPRPAVRWQDGRPFVAHRLQLAGELILLAALVWLVAYFAGRLVITDRLHGWWLVALIIWLLWWFLPQSHRPFAGVTRSWWLVWLAVGLTLVVVGRNAAATSQFQGRFLFPSMGALTLVGVAGWYALLPGRPARAILPLALALMIAANVIVFTGVIGVYYQPFLD
jgi:hypothetical protein